MKSILSCSVAILLLSVVARSQAGSAAGYEKQVKRFKPEHGLAALNSNDVRHFVYEWFSHFEHAAPPDFYLDHLADKNLYVSFPGRPAFLSPADFARWYNTLIAQTLWNFHDLSTIQVKLIAPQEFLVSFVVNWYGEVRQESDPAASWQSRKDSYMYHYTLRQTWTVRSNDKLIIEKLVVSSGDTPSPIRE